MDTITHQAPVGRPDAGSTAAVSTVSVFGLGYVGCVSAACLAARGHRVIGIDVSQQKLDFIAAGKAPVVEDRIGDLTAAQVEQGRLRVTSDTVSAVSDSDISLVCVGTPSASNGSLSTHFLERVASEIGTAIAQKNRWHVVVFRSTMLPGTCEKLLIPLLESASRMRAGTDFGVCVNPEFLREGTSVADFFDPPKTVVGQSDDRSGDQVMSLYDGLPGPRFRVPITVAEMIKYVDNSFHAFKVGFANEIGAVSASLGVDSHAVTDIFLADTKLNISPSYLRPGFAFGGSCLPKDVRALIHVGRRNDLDLPLLNGLLTSNEAHLRRAVDQVINFGKRDVAVFGLSFKAGTDDLRESPMVELVERLLGKGFRVQIYDANVSLSRLVGANRSFLEERLPHIGKLLTDDLDRVAAHGEAFVVGSREPAVAAKVDGLGPGHPVLDLVRLPNADVLAGRPGYRGIAW